MTKAIYLDMDGTIANLYAVDGWLENLRAYDPRPYIEALTMVNMQVLARLLNRKQKEGYTIGIISWLSKKPTAEYDALVTQAKLDWLRKHLASVRFDEIHIVPYGTPKSQVAQVKGGVLFDDEEPNRKEWGANAYGAENILEILKKLL